MKLPHINGRKSVSINVSKYRVDWDRPCRSQFQFNIKQFFRDYWFADECYEELPVVGTKLSCDLVNFTRKFAVESDGNFHNKFSKFHHKTLSGFSESIKRDDKKDNWLTEMGIYVIRISEKNYKNLSLDWLKEKFDIDIEEKFIQNE